MPKPLLWQINAILLSCHSSSNLFFHFALNLQCLQMLLHPSWLHPAPNDFVLNLSPFGLYSFFTSFFAPDPSFCPLGHPLFTVWAPEPFTPSLLQSFNPVPCLSPPRRAALSFHYSTSQSSSCCPLCVLIGSNRFTQHVCQLHPSTLRCSLKVDRFEEERAGVLWKNYTLNFVFGHRKVSNLS